MLSVTESAAILDISPSRVRALIAQGQLPAQKVGNAWILKEEDVMQRITERPKNGCPKKQPLDEQTYTAPDTTPEQASFHEIYLLCKQLGEYSPSAEEIAGISHGEEAAFRIAVADFFLQRKQATLIKQEVY